jgi:hypothetical protein
MVSKKLLQIILLLIELLHHFHSLPEQKFCVQRPLIKTVAEFSSHLLLDLASQGWCIHIRDLGWCLFDASAVGRSRKEGGKLLVFTRFGQFFKFHVLFSLLVCQSDLLFKLNFFLNFLLQPHLLAIFLLLIKLRVSVFLLHLFLLLPIPLILFLNQKVLLPFKSFRLLLSFTISPLLFLHSFFFLLVSLQLLFLKFLLPLPF